jgi:very-short-patch-repair endonuclease
MSCTAITKKGTKCIRKLKNDLYCANHIKYIHFNSLNSHCGATYRQLCDNDDCKSCFERSFASHEKSKYWSDTNDIKPRNVLKSKGLKYKFDCDKCMHVFECTLNNIVDKKVWCNYCSNRTLCDNIYCQICFNKSFASHEKSKYWSPDNVFKSREIFKGTREKYLFDCECNHQFEMIIANITSLNEWCAFCAGKVLCINDDCKDCFNKSFASHEKSKYWSDKNNKIPREVFKSTDTKWIFNCDKCLHEFDCSTSHITNSDRWCSYCANRRLCNNKNCQICFNKSFASHEKSKHWSDKNTKSPRDVFKSAAENFIFNCPDCNHEYINSLNDISSGNCFCSCTKNKTEAKLYDFLLNEYKSLNIEKQYKFEWCKNIRSLPFDFLIEEYKLLLELDGGQHFKQVSNWDSPEEIQKRDIFKMKSANENGYSMVRINQEDVWNNRNDWQNKLKDSIKKYNTPKNIFIGEIYNSTIKFKEFSNSEFK